MKVYKAYPVRVDAVNKPEQEWLVEFTLVGSISSVAAFPFAEGPIKKSCLLQAYMLADTLLYLLPYTPTDFLFCTHHAVVIVYAVSALTGGRGAISYVVLTLIGECTSLWQNSWYICNIFKSQNKVRIVKHID